MWKSWRPASPLLAVLIAACGTQADTPASKSSPDTPPSPVAEDEPITGTAAKPVPGSESPMRDPFGAYDTGGGVWTVDALSPSERAIALKGQDVRGWDQVHAAYSHASAQAAQHARVQAAQHELGVDSLGGLGVVP